MVSVRTPGANVGAVDCLGSSAPELDIGRVPELDVGPAPELDIGPAPEFDIGPAPWHAE